MQSPFCTAISVFGCQSPFLYCNLHFVLQFPFCTAISVFGCQSPFFIAISFLYCNLRFWMSISFFYCNLFFVLQSPFCIAIAKDLANFSFRNETTLLKVQDSLFYEQLKTTMEINNSILSWIGFSSISQSN